MKNIYAGMALLFFVLFSSSSVIGQQGNIQTSTNNHPQNKHSEQNKNADKTPNQKDGKAEYELGEKYFEGKGVPKEYTKAAEWYRKAAEQGDAFAQSELGSMYYNGEGVTKDYTEAVKWYRKAAEQGNVLARFSLGKLLEETDYPGWGYLSRSDTEYFFINKNKIRQQGNLVWYWTMEVPFQESHSGKKCTKNCRVADCDSARSGLVSYIDYDSNGEIIRSHTLKESEIDMSPAMPDSIGEGYLEYACSHAKVGTYKKEETAKTEACFGTGWSVASGFVVTNNHVVEGRNHIILIRPDGVKIPASVAAHDAFNDLALLKVEDTGLLPAALPLSSKPAVLGEKVVTIGYPHPDLLGVKPKLTEGVINSTSGLGDDPRALQISVPIQAGNSGGPLVNMEGQVVGIVTSKVDAVKMFKWKGDLPQNINYGIKTFYLKGLLSSVSQKQRIDTLAPFKYTSVQGLAKKIRNSVLIIMAK
ncbi:MAG: tetratricopeptide repeat-containing serine protease family protein [Thermodesulfobacteriota bacterium]|nr:tetratricopeptide repeat-containing serine protease family protein [Thermodesulfobacteriota bacterium]